MGLGVTQNMHVANASGKGIHVIPALKLEWAIADVITDIALVVYAVSQIRAAVTVAELPAAIERLNDLYKFLKIAEKLLGGAIAIGSRPTEAALALVDAFKKNSIPIASRHYEDLKDNNVLGMYLNTSGIAGMMGASTLSVIVMSDDGKQVAMSETGPDASWIATDRGLIVRSRYGAIWEEDPWAGFVNWPIGGN